MGSNVTLAQFSDRKFTLPPIKSAGVDKTSVNQRNRRKPRQTCRAVGWRLHIAPVLPAHLEQGIGNLAEGTDPDRIDQYGENVVVIAGGPFQAFQHGWGRLGMAFVESGQTPPLRLLFPFR
jgi:hypothetical protein